MPAAPPGTVQATWYNGQGVQTIQITYHFDPATGLFDTNPAIGFVNSTGRTQTIWVYLSGETTPRSVTMPTGTGSVTRNQISNFTGGAVTSYYDGGWTLDPANF